MLFGVEIWCAPIKDVKAGPAQRGGSVGFTKKMALVQRVAAIFVTEAMRSTLTVALDTHADFLPIELLINHICYRAALQWATKPKEHPLNDLVEFATREGEKFNTYPPLLTGLFKVLNLDLLHMEKIDIMRLEATNEHPDCAN